MYGNQSQTSQSASGGQELLADRAYAYLRDEIVSVRMSPGAVVSESQVGRATGVGRAPVREAVKRLAFESLINIYPRRGTFVSDIRVSDAQWLTEVRVPLEGAAAALSAVRATDAECSELQEVGDTLGEATDVASLLMLDAQVHRLMFRCAHNPYLRATLDQYFNLALRIWHYCLDTLPDLEAHVLGQHNVIAAITARDAEAARTAAQHHLTECTDEIRRAIWGSPGP